MTTDGQEISGPQLAAIKAQCKRELLREQPLMSEVSQEAVIQLLKLANHKELFLLGHVLSSMGQQVNTVVNRSSENFKAAEASAAQLGKIAVTVARAALKQLEE